MYIPLDPDSIALEPDSTTLTPDSSTRSKEANTTTPQDFKLTSGEDVLKTYNGTKSNSGASPGRVFCSNCGSNIMITPSSGDPIVIITSGCLDGEDGAKLGEGPQMELFCKRAEKWLDVKNESKKFQTMPGQ